MAFNDLHSIKNYTGYNTLRRLNGSRRSLANRISSSAGNRFKNILTAFQTHNSDNIRRGFKTTSNKTRGLTIADYRTRPVVSKSRYRPQLESATAKLKTAVTNRFSEHETPPVIKKDLSKNLQPEIRNPKFITANQPKVESRTTRTAGGLDFNVIGAKRQGCEVPQSLRVETVDSRARSRPGGIWKTQLTQQQIIDQHVQKAAEKYDLSPDLIKGVIRAESNFKVKAISSAGAQGLMQLMPATAKELGVKNPFDIAQNIDGGAKYLRKMLDRFGGNVRKALAAYNAGPGTVIKYNGRVPYPETRQYVKRVLRFSRQMA
jgi:hypothetical protein